MRTQKIHPKKLKGEKLILPANPNLNLNFGGNKSENKFYINQNIDINSLSLDDWLLLANVLSQHIPTI